MESVALSQLAPTLQAAVIRNVNAALSEDLGIYPSYLKIPACERSCGRIAALQSLDGVNDPSTFCALHCIPQSSPANPVSSGTKGIDDDSAPLTPEDLLTRDLSAGLLPEQQTSQALVISREPATLCGQAWFEMCFLSLDPNFKIAWHVAEGQPLHAGQTICRFSGNTRALLSAERAALNFLQLLSGIATVTTQFVEQLAGTSTVIMDTRKTLPGLRQAQKYAVHIGGGKNQRMGLYDGILLKENHIAAAGGVVQAYRAALALKSAAPIQVEVETLEQLNLLLEQGCQLILLDNFSLDQIQQAVQLAAGRAQLEVSGGITLDQLPQLAQTGVDRISVGALTKHVRAIDLSMRFI